MFTIFAKNYKIMPRRRKRRRIFLPPKIRGFSTYGFDTEESAIIFLDEFEAIKLLDYENLNQVKVAAIMNISRPTLTRIYDRARKKIALALVEGKNIEIRGGDVYTEDHWHYCSNCDIAFNTHDMNMNCPFCKSDVNVRSMNDYISDFKSPAQERTIICKVCNYEQKIDVHPLRQRTRCRKCNSTIDY